MKKICIWPDGTWCDKADVETAGRGMSDDYEVVDLPEVADDVEAFVIDHLKQQPNRATRKITGPPRLPRKPDVADVSTCHITLEDSNLLNQGGQPCQIGVFEYGYVARTVSRISELSDRVKAAGFSPAYLSLLQLAYEQGCHYIIIDRDGPIVEGLPKFDW